MPPTPRYVMYSIMYTLNAAVYSRLSLVPLIVAECAVAGVRGDKIEYKLSEIAGLLLKRCFCLVILRGSVRFAAIGVADGGCPFGEGVISARAPATLIIC